MNAAAGEVDAWDASRAAKYAAWAAAKEAAWAARDAAGHDWAAAGAAQNKRLTAMVMAARRRGREK